MNLTRDDKTFLLKVLQIHRERSNTLAAGFRNERDHASAEEHQSDAIHCEQLIKMVKSEKTTI